MPSHGISRNHQAVLMHIGNIDVRLGLRALAYEVAVALLVEHRKLVAAVVVNICSPGKDDGVYSPQHRDGLICKVLDIGTDLVDADLPVVLVGIAEAGNGVALIPQSLNPGRYAIFLYKGPYDNLQAVYDTIYGKCLPEMECTLRDEPSAERYLNNPCETAPEELLTEIYIPVE